MKLWITMSYHGSQLFFENHSDFRRFLGSSNCESPPWQRLMKSEMINGHSYFTEKSTICQNPFNVALQVYYWWFQNSKYHKAYKTGGMERKCSTWEIKLEKRRLPVLQGRKLFFLVRVSSFYEGKVGHANYVLSITRYRLS